MLRAVPSPAARLIPGTGPVSHTCPAPGCRRTVADKFLMCPPDWRRVPADLQRLVYAAWRGGLGAGTPELAAAQDAAVLALIPPQPAGERDDAGQ